MDGLKTLSDKIIFGGDLPFTVEPGGVGKSLFSKMSEAGSTIAQVHGYTGEIDTYEALLQRCVRTAITMSNMGISQDDVISICSHNTLDNLVPMIAGFFIGAISATLDPTLSVANTVELIKHVSPKMIFVSPEALEVIESSIKESGICIKMIVFGQSNKHLEFSKFIDPLDEEKNFKPIDTNLKRTALICFTSGTTGIAKGVCLSHWSILCQANRLVYSGYNMDRLLFFGSLYWNIYTILLLGCILNKGCRVAVPNFDINTVWKLLSRVKVTTLFIPPVRARLMINQGSPENISTNLQFVGLLGDYVGAELVSNLEKTFPKATIFVGYGLTETSGSCIRFLPGYLNDEELFRKKPESIGRVTAGFTAKVVDPDTEEILGPYQEGELRIKSSIQMSGYYNYESNNAWDSDGWLKTGDIVYYDNDRCFYVTERMKEIIRVKQYRISPISIEKILIRYPGVETCAVVGKQLPLTEEVVLVGIVELKKDAINKVNAKDIEKYMKENVDDRQQLRGGIKIVSSIPLTTTGKVNRQRIRELIAQGSL